VVFNVALWWLVVPGILFDFWEEEVNGVAVKPLKN
jgi:hypothetical protein